MKGSMPRRAPSNGRHFYVDGDRVAIDELDWTDLWRRFFAVGDPHPIVGRDGRMHND